VWVVPGLHFTHGVSAQSGSGALPFLSSWGYFLKFEGIIFACWQVAEAASVSAADYLHFYLVNLDILHNISAYEPYDHQPIA
jgi:hypothetical protein